MIPQTVVTFETSLPWIWYCRSSLVMLKLNSSLIISAEDFQLLINKFRHKFIKTAPNKKDTFMDCYSLFLAESIVVLDNSSC